MNRSNELRKTIKSILQRVPDLKGIYYKRADEKALFPHVVYMFANINRGDLSRQDYSVEIDVWCRDDEERSQEIADTIEDLFDQNNAPQDSILPTFYLESRMTVIDEDKHINHELIKLVTQNYVR